MTTTTKTGSQITKIFLLQISDKLLAQFKFRQQNEIVVSMNKSIDSRQSAIICLQKSGDISSIICNFGPNRIAVQHK